MITFEITGYPLEARTTVHSCTCFNSLDFLSSVVGKLRDLLIYKSSCCTDFVFHVAVCVSWFVVNMDIEIELLRLQTNVSRNAICPSFSCSTVNSQDIIDDSSYFTK